MKGDKIFTSQEQLQRLRVMGLVEAEKISLKDGTGKMGISYRQAKRIWKRVREKGTQDSWMEFAAVLLRTRIPDKVKKWVLELSRQKYREFNDRHFWEQLLEQEEIALGREMVRIIRREAGLLPTRKRRAPPHRKRRERKAQESWIVLWDGSPHPLNRSRISFVEGFLQRRDSETYLEGFPIYNLGQENGGSPPNLSINKLGGELGQNRVR